MSIWRKIIDALERVAGSLSALVASPTPPERSVAFTIAVVSLGAKLAKADGQVTRDEVSAFRQVFVIPDGEAANAARVFNLAREDVAGFDGYARRIRAMFDAEDGRATLEDILDGLFHIAGADGVYHPAELAFLSEVAEIFGVAAPCFDRLRARHDPAIGGDPYLLLGVARTDDLATIRSAWRALAREAHPDRAMARGLPEEAVSLATERLRMLNGAWERIQREHGAGRSAGDAPANTSETAH